MAELDAMNCTKENEAYCRSLLTPYCLTGKLSSLVTENHLGFRMEGFTNKIGFRTTASRF